MAQTDNDTTCTMVCWGFGGVSGLGVLIIGVQEGLWFLVSLILGIAFAVWFGLFLQRKLCGTVAPPWEGQSLGELTGMEPLSPQRKRELGLEEEPPTPAPAPQQAAPAPAPKPAAAPTNARAAAPEAPAAETKAATTTATEGAAESKPALRDAPRAGGADDLKKIKGVGPKLEKVLNEMGVYHFDQIAGWSAAEVAWVDANLEGFRGRVSRDDWVTQARALAAGERG
ncbi:NADH:ubiquinone oxidoreductase [Rhodosalinus sediminis]|uniref:NADH:ubiquinone oxidoreductase n=1 Tax=Rhodosalinus sediminis TaxID=1940533 RepID=UPI00235463E0|nr:NADH:ubiquinone oxidoreductase [Rhodosalinus sediminis]